MTPSLLGQLAALLASVGFSLGPTFYTLSGRAIGSRHTLRMRLLLSTLLLMLWHGLKFGAWYPVLTLRAWATLFLSGAIGLALADIFLFEAFVRIGPRLSMLILTLVPVLTTAAAWVLYAERLSLAQLLAMALVLGGIAWVVGRGQRAEEGPFTMNPQGVGFAFLAAFLSALSALMAKDALMYETMDPMAANLIRMSGGMVPLWVWTAVQGQVAELAHQLRQHRLVWLYLLLGSLAGPVIGMSLQMFAYQTIPIGLATTLTSLPPILLLPISRFVFREGFTWHAVAGTVLAVVGVAWLMGLSV